MPVTVRYTYHDLLSIPEDRNRYELFDGDLAVTPAPSPEHQLTVINIIKTILGYLQHRKSGVLLTAPCDVRFTEEVVVQPDILFITHQRMGIIKDNVVAGAPDMIAEVLSSSTEERDRGYKFKLYAQEGVREYWLADPEKRLLEVYTLGESGYQLLGAFKGSDNVCSGVFPDLAFTAKDLWV